MVPWTNFQMSLHIWPVVKLSQTKKTESLSKWIWVFNCSELTSAKDVVKPNAFAPLEMPKMSPSELLMTLSPLEAPKMLASPLEAPEIPWDEPLEMPPLEELYEHRIDDMPWQTESQEHPVWREAPKTKIWVHDMVSWVVPCKAKKWHGKTDKNHVKCSENMWLLRL